MSDLTLALNRMSDGGLAAGELLPLVYDELRRLAARKMAGEASQHTLQATALVHEAWLRLGGEAQSWENRAHFFGAAAEAMRRILVDQARGRRAFRHGGGMKRVDIEAVEIAAPAEEEELLHVHEALGEFAASHPQKAELVKLRYFVGLTGEEAATVMGISAPTATRYWAFARIWLYRRIRRLAEEDGPARSG